MSGTTIWRLGYSGDHMNRGREMLRIDGAYLYELGTKLRPVLTLKEEQVRKIEIHHVISPASDGVEKFINESVFSPHLRTVRISATNLLSNIKKMEIDISNLSSFDEEISEWTIRILKEEFRKFEAILLAELQNSPLYLVFSKGGFDVVCLTDDGLALFPATFNAKVPEAAEDAAAGAKCIAFEVFTAAGFHFHRANEAVLRRYFDVVAGETNRPRSRNIGDYIKKMESLNVGDSRVLDVLKSIKDLHRNPLMHPDDRIETADEALSLYAAIRAAIGYMLDRIPIAALPPPTATPA